MNFTREIKREIVRRAPEDRAARAALLAAALHCCAERRDGEISFTIENEETAELLLELAERLAGVKLVLSGASRDPRRGLDRPTFSCAGEDAERLSAFAERPVEETDARAYAAGAFLFCGSCTLPRAGKKTGYHLEFAFPRENAERLIERFARAGLCGNAVSRGERRVFYVKSREGILEFLSAIGAENAGKAMGEIVAAREENNNENRILNCYQGNADKAAIASAAQVSAIRGLFERGESLSPLLREAAEARVSHPEASLSELAALMGVGKSCLNHRLRKLMEICKKSGVRTDAPDEKND